MRRILDEIQKVSEIDSIILSNNNPEIRIEDWIGDYTNEITVINQPIPTLYTIRFEIAYKTSYEYFFCPDDDVFLSHQQINNMLCYLQENPTVPHGIWGQIRAYRDGDYWLGPDVKQINCEVDVLNRAYFFTHAHMARVMELSNALGHNSINEAIFMEDVLLSFSGATRPLCHDIGPIAECLTSNSHGIATHTKAGFAETRLDGYQRLVTITGRI